MAESTPTQVEVSLRDDTASFDQLGDAVLCVESCGKIVAFNRGAELLYGWSRFEACGRTIEDLLGEVWCPEARGAAPGQAHRYQVAHLRKGGRRIQVDVVASPVRTALGVKPSYLCVNRVLRDDEQSRTELTEVNAFLEAIIENLPLMVFVKDAERLSFIRFNRAGEELLGMPRTELLGKTDHDFWPSEQVEHFIRKDRETLSVGKLVEIPEEPIQSAFGRRWLRTKKIPLRDRNGKPAYLLGISEDITDQKRINEELRSVREELEQRVLERTAELSKLNSELSAEIVERKQAERALRETEEQLRHAHKMEAVGLLAGGVAHDFNNLLTVIAGYAGALRSDSTTPESVKEELAQICKATEQATQLTRQLLAFSRRQVLQPETLDLNHILAELEKMLKRLIGEDIQLLVRLAPRPALVKADPGQLEQVILNLVVNARDAIESGGRIVIEAAHVEFSEATRHAASRVCLTVTDSGQGMDEATRSRIFEPFFTTKERGRGTGLGLATVYGIVEQSGGSITVWSEPGSGSSFRILLPAAVAEPEVELPPARVSEDVKSGLAVLLVEDEEMVRAVTRRALAQRGFQVFEAASPFRALELFSADPARFDLILTDVVMPGMNGPTMIERFCELRPNLKVLYMSGYTDNALVDRAVTERGHAFLQKPFTPTELVDKVLELAAQRTRA